jgi:hypothetical protein
MRRYEKDRGIEILHTVTTAILVRSLLNAQVRSMRRCVQLNGEHELLHYSQLRVITFTTECGAVQQNGWE